MTDRLIAVLSGGGVRTAAHLGALRVLMNRGMVPTRYVGTSMGAVIATALALGLSPDEAIARLMAVRPRDVFAVDRTALIKGVWARSLLRPERLRRTLEALIPATRFGELTTPLSVTATDLDTGELLVFGAGGADVPLIDALCASCALPLFFPPFVIEGRRCADGGLRGVVPLATAASFPADLVVAIDVGSGFDMIPGVATRELPALLRLQNDAQRILFATGTELARALWKATPERPPLLWIRPTVRLGEIFATDQLQYYIEEGRKAAEAALGSWKP